MISPPPVFLSHSSSLSLSLYGVYIIIIVVYTGLLKGRAYRRLPYSPANRFLVF